MFVFKIYYGSNLAFVLCYKIYEGKNYILFNFTLIVDTRVFLIFFAHYVGFKLQLTTVIIDWMLQYKAVRTRFILESDWFISENVWC